MAAEQLITNNTRFGEMLQEGINVGSCCKLSAQLGPGCEELLESGTFEFMVSELIDNCAEKPVEGVEIGVSVTFDEPSGVYRLVVEDNVRYSPAQLQAIMKNLRRKYSQSQDKTPDKRIRGGLGKSMISNSLARWGGSLAHEATEDGRVVAVAQWQREYFLHPLPQGTQPAYIKRV